MGGALGRSWRLGGGTQITWIGSEKTGGRRGGFPPLKDFGPRGEPRDQGAARGGNEGGPGPARRSRPKPGGVIDPPTIMCFRRVFPPEKFYACIFVASGKGGRATPKTGPQLVLPGK